MEQTSFGRYELRGLLGRGGMGEVYEAFDREQSRVVALKLLPPALIHDEGFVERFRRESLAAARLSDPHIIPIHRFGDIDGQLYLDMRLVRGRDLGQVLAEDGPLPLDRAVSFVSQAAEALDAAHAENLVHRDVKPSNLLVTAQDFVYLVDFGIAHVFGLSTSGQALTATGATIGTLDYMAPERFIGRTEIDARADVYSLACVLFEILTGSRPYPVDGLPALMRSHLEAPPPRAGAVRPDVPPALDRVIAVGMAKDPDERYASTGDLARAAAEAVHGPRRVGPGPTGPVAPVTRLEKASGGTPPPYAPRSGSPSLPDTTVRPIAFTPPADSGPIVSGQLGSGQFGSGPAVPFVPPPPPPPPPPAFVPPTFPPPAAGSGPPDRGGNRAAVWVVAAASVVVIALIAGVLVWQLRSGPDDANGPVAGSMTGTAAPPTGSSATATTGSTTAASSTSSSVAATSVPATTVVVTSVLEQTVTTQITPPTTAPPVAPTAAPPVAPRPASDLGLPQPIANVGCTGQYVTLVQSSTTPGSYAAEIAGWLAAYPQASYLRTDASCGALAQELDGNAIYAVYVGPFNSAGAACAARPTPQSYVKVMNSGTAPDDATIDCN